MELNESLQKVSGSRSAVSVILTFLSGFKGTLRSSSVVELVSGLDSEDEDED
jgi:hypothetical protein